MGCINYLIYKAIFDECNAAEDKDFEVLLKNEHNYKGRRSSLEHIIQLDTAKEMAIRYWTGSCMMYFYIRKNKGRFTGVVKQKRRFQKVAVFAVVLIRVLMLSLFGRQKNTGENLSVEEVQQQAYEYLASQYSSKFTITSAKHEPNVVGPIPLIQFLLPLGADSSI